MEKNPVSSRFLNRLHLHGAWAFHSAVSIVAVFVGAGATLAIGVVLWAPGEVAPSQSPVIAGPVLACLAGFAFKLAHNHHRFSVEASLAIEDLPRQDRLARLIGRPSP